MLISSISHSVLWLIYHWWHILYTPQSVDEGFRPVGNLKGHIGQASSRAEASSLLVTHYDCDCGLIDTEVLVCYNVCLVLLVCYIRYQLKSAGGRRPTPTERYTRFEG